MPEIVHQVLRFAGLRLRRQRVGRATTLGAGLRGKRLDQIDQRFPRHHDRGRIAPMARVLQSLFSPG